MNDYRTHYIVVNEDGYIIALFDDFGMYLYSDQNPIVLRHDSALRPYLIDPTEDEYLYNYDGIPRYKYVDGTVVKRSDAELDQQMQEILDNTPPTAFEQLRADVDFLGALSGIPM